MKIDRSFVEGLGRSAEDAAIVEAIISMGEALRVGVIAEGVETQAQADRLQALGCKLAQGHLFSRPLDQAATRAHSPEGSRDQGGELIKRA